MRVPILIAALFVTSNSFSQTTSLPTKELIPIPKGQTDWSSQVTMTDHMGRPFRRDYSEVRGSPFYFEDWKPANARTDSATLTGIKKIKIDLYNHEIDCIAANNDSLTIQDGIIRQFILLDSAKSGRNYLFRSGYPAIDKNNANSFFLVLADGNIQLLKSSRKELRVNKNDMTGETNTEFVQYDDYYVFHNGQITRLKRDKDYVLGLMSDQQKKMDEYLKDKKVNYKNPESVAVVFDYYNSLQKAF
jgi:hypothetical protein